MAMQSVRARDFWHKLERQKSLDETDFFQRGTTFRSSFNSTTAPLNTSLHGPVWGSIYCTMRDRSKGNRGRSSSASDSNNFQSQRDGRLSSPRSTSTSERSTPSPGRTKYRKMPENEVELPQKNYTAPKRYETTCYFMPLAVPVWYSTSVSIKINSTKRNYKETVNYQNKLVPYRFVETMTTDICGKAPPVLYVSEEMIEKKLPANEHYISLESQQKSEINLDKPFMTNHHIAIENHT